MRTLASAAYLVLLPLVGSLAVPARAITIHVKWLGEATAWYPEREPNNPPIVEAISIPVEGLLEIDLAAVQAEPTFSENGLHWSWMGESAPVWQTKAGTSAGAPSDFIDNAQFFSACDAICEISWISSDPRDGFRIDMDMEEVGSGLKLHADGTGTWYAGDFTRTIGFIEGNVSSYEISIIPEPSAALIFALGIAMVGRASRRT